MYSEELMNYLYSYDMPSKQKGHNDTNNKIPANKNKVINFNTLKKLHNAYAIVPIELHHE